MTSSIRYRVAVTAAVGFAFVALIEFIILQKNTPSNQSLSMAATVDYGNLDAVLDYPSLIEIPANIPAMSRHKVTDVMGAEISVNSYGSTIGVVDRADYLHGHYLV